MAAPSPIVKPRIVESQIIIIIIVGRSEDAATRRAETHDSCRRRVIIFVVIAISARVQTVILRTSSATAIVFIHIPSTGRATIRPITVFKGFICRNCDLIIRTMAIHLLAFGFQRLFRRHKINVVLSPSSTRCKESYNGKSYLFHIVSFLCDFAAKIEIYPIYGSALPRNLEHFVSFLTIRMDCCDFCLPYPTSCRTFAA